MPGSGKGTQAKLLVKYNFKHISTGDLIREAFRKKDPSITKYKDIVEKGEFIPDEEIFKIVEKDMKRSRRIKNLKGYIFDGTIRNIPQAKIALQKNLVDELFFFKLNKDQAEKRLKKRLKIEGRKDDDSETIKKRIKKYQKQTKPIVDYFSKNNISIITIDASLSVEEIHKKVLEELKIK